MFYSSWIIFSRYCSDSITMVKRYYDRRK